MTTESDLYCVLSPAVKTINNQVESLRLSQNILREKIDDVINELKRVGDELPISIDVDPHMRRLITAKRRIVLVNNIVQNVLERLERLNRSINVQTLKKQAIVEAQLALIKVAQQP